MCDFIWPAPTTYKLYNKPDNMLVDRWVAVTVSDKMIKKEPGNIVFDRPDIGHSQGDKMIKPGNIWG